VATLSPANLRLDFRKASPFELPRMIGQAERGRQAHREGGRPRRRYYASFMGNTNSMVLDGENRQEKISLMSRVWDEVVLLAWGEVHLSRLRAGGGGGTKADGHANR